MTSRFGPRATREPRASRVPIATSLWPDSSGRDQGEQRVQVGGQVHVHVGQDVGVAGDQIARSARPRPGSVELDRADAAAARAASAGGDVPGAVGAAVVGDRDPCAVNGNPLAR